MEKKSGTKNPVTRKNISYNNMLIKIEHMSSIPELSRQLQYKFKTNN